MLTNGHFDSKRFPSVEPEYFSDVYVEDASFLKMDNIQLGYTFRGLRGVQRLRVFGTIQNAFTITGYSGVDPESFAITRANGFNLTNIGIDNNLYPRSRTYVLGTNVTF